MEQKNRQNTLIIVTNLLFFIYFSELKRYTSLTIKDPLEKIRFDIFFALNFIQCVSRYEFTSSTKTRFERVSFLTKTENQQSRHLELIIYNRFH